VCAFCFCVYQPASADQLDGKIRLASNPSITSAALSSDLLVNQNVPPKPPISSASTVQETQALLVVFGGSLLGLVFIARRKKA